MAIRGELERILSSRAFRLATGQARFLKYAVEQTIAGQHIKEQSIGSEAFGRGPLFDSRLDPIVRTQALKLRAKLARYYETNGVNDDIRIEMIKGSYNPRFRRRDGSGIEVVARLAQGRQLSPARAYDATNRDIG
jgi:hypothetical protein